MRLAVFTNEFPSRLTSFFARDMRGLLEAGAELDIYPIYPLDARLWSCVPDILNDDVLPRARVHHIALPAGFRWRWAALQRLGGFAADAARIGTSAVRHGVGPVAKTAYVTLKAWAWAQHYAATTYDHILAYWGSYAATAAYLFQRLTGPHVPFSMFARASADLYLDPVYLAPKMLYADNLFTICEFNRAYLEHRYPGIFARLEPKLHLYYEGLDFGRIRFDPDGRPPRTILAVGRFEELKGFRHLLRAVDALARRGLAVELQLIGGGEQEGELRALVERLGLARQVSFRGWLLPDDVLCAMRQATVLVHAPIALDTMPVVIKEAMAVGTPVIGSDILGIPEMLDRGRCGMLVAPADVAGLAGAIETLLADAALRARYAHAARRHGEHRFDLWSNSRRLADQLRATPPRGQLPLPSPERSVAARAASEGRAREEQRRWRSPARPGPMAATLPLTRGR